MLRSTGPKRLLFRLDALFSKQKEYFPLICRKQASEDKNICLGNHLSQIYPTRTLWETSAQGKVYVSVREKESTDGQP